MKNNKDCGNKELSSYCSLRKNAVFCPTFIIYLIISTHIIFSIYWYVLEKKNARQPSRSEDKFERQLKIFCKNVLKPCQDFSDLHLI